MLFILAGCSGPTPEQTKKATIDAHKRQVISKLGIKSTVEFHHAGLYSPSGVEVMCGLVEATDIFGDRNFQRVISTKSGLVYFEEDLVSEEAMNEVWLKFCGDI